MGKLVMGYWDCPYCDKKEIRGDTAVCPACGQELQPGAKFCMNCGQKL